MPGVGGIRQDVLGAPPMKCQQSSDEIYSPSSFPASSVFTFDARSPTATGLFFIKLFSTLPRNSQSPCFSRASSKSHDASLFDPHRHHAAQERRICARCVPSNLRSALGYRDRGLLPRAVRQDPRQPRGGEQVVEGRLKACRRVPSQVRLQHPTAHILWFADSSRHTPDG